MSRRWRSCNRPVSVARRPDQPVVVVRGVPREYGVESLQCPVNVCS
jgi:hypothetical protein